MGFGYAAGSGALTALVSLLFFMSASFIFSIIFWIVAKRMMADAAKGMISKNGASKKKKRR